MEEESSGAPPVGADSGAYSANYPVYCDWVHEEPHWSWAGKGMWAPPDGDDDENAPRKKYRGPPGPIRDETKQRYREALELVLKTVNNEEVPDECKMTLIRDVCVGALAFVEKYHGTGACTECHKEAGQMTMGGRCYACHMSALEPRFYKQ